MRTTRNSTSWAITENGNASHFSFFCQVIAFKMSSDCNAVNPFHYNFLCDLLVLGLKVTQKIGENWWFTAGSTRNQLLILRKFKCFVWLVIFAAVIEVHQRTWHASLKWSAFGLFCAIVLGCCTFLVEKVLLPNSGQFWLSGAGEGSWIVLKVVAGDATAQVSGSCLFVGAEG